MSNLQALNEYLQSFGIVHITAEEIAVKYGFPPEDLWHNIIPTCLVLESIRKRLREITGLDIILHINNGYRASNTANGSWNHAHFYAIDWVAWIRNGKEYTVYSIENTAKLVWNYYLTYGKQWRMGAGYYKNPEGMKPFFHIDMYEPNTKEKPRPGVWEDFDAWEANKQGFWKGFAPELGLKIEEIK